MTLLVAMVQTRAEIAAQQAHNSPTEQGQQSASATHPSPDRPAQGQTRSIEETPDSVRAKRRRTSTPAAVETATESDPIAVWIRDGRWTGRDSKPEMEHALARKRSTNSPHRKRSDSGSSATPSDQRPREEKSAPYRDPRYRILLETKGSFMAKSDVGITEDSKKTCSNLLNAEQSVPKDSIFRDDLFEQTCQSVEDRNEARVLRYISPMIVPAAETLAIYGDVGLECLVETINEGWNNSIPLTGTRPQPDYSVGFRRQAFTDAQLTKLSPFIGDFLGGDLSLFMATYRMYFPFLACEVKCGALDVADCQNAHSMTLAARGVVELFRLVGRESEVDRQILSFSISHDHRSVRIYGYYPVIESKDTKDTKYYRHPIHNFYFTALDGKDKWTAYRFTKNVYDIWMPKHFERIRSAIDQLPEKLDFDYVLSKIIGTSFYYY
ncbi:hypothetical protein V8C35DRAFT_288066 [Trichoderma chlorosporum]